MPTLAEIHVDLQSKLGDAVSVVVSRMRSEPGLESRKLNLTTEAATGFRDLCRSSVELLARMAAISYSSDAELSSGEAFLLEDRQSLDELSDLRSIAQQASTLPVIAPRDLDLSIQLYAVVLGDQERVVFVRRVDPQIKYKAGGFLAIAGTQLRLLDEPAFSFSPGFDLVVTDRWVVILNQSAFERLFKDIGLIDRHITQWVKGITDHLPMDETSVAALRDVAARDPRTWRKLREISRRGHLAQVSLPEVRKYARKMGLEPNHIVRDGRLVFAPGDRFSFLHLLNEDLYKGPLTEEAFEAQRKSPAGS